MTFLAPWAFAIGGVAALATLVLHLVARQRPAAHLFPTTRFIPDQRTLVSRAATRPRDLLLLAIRMLLLLSAAAAFARPVLSPRGGVIARVVLLDRSRAVADPASALARARSLVSADTQGVVIGFDTSTAVLSMSEDSSLTLSTIPSAPGSLSAAFAAAKRTAVSLAEHADSVQLVVVSPLAASEFDSATMRLRRAWPGAIRLERVPLRVGAMGSWALEGTLPVSDPLGPSVAGQRGGAGARTTRLMRTPLTSGDSAFARAGGTVVTWDASPARLMSPEGLAAGDDVVVATLGRRAIADAGLAIARWSDGSPAAREVRMGTGCVRTVGVAMPAAGDLALHPPFQRIVRSLLAPCGLGVADTPLDSTSVAALLGPNGAAATARSLRSDTDRTTPLARWLLGVAMLLAVVELVVRARMGEQRVAPSAAGAA